MLDLDPPVIGNARSIFSLHRRNHVLLVQDLVGSLDRACHDGPAESARGPVVSRTDDAASGVSQPVCRSIIRWTRG
jgi:hypothetical protein